MTKPQQNPNRSDGRLCRLGLAAITGLISGATRAILDALLHHL